MVAIAPQKCPCFHIEAKSVAPLTKSDAAEGATSLAASLMMLLSAWYSPFACARATAAAEVDAGFSAAALDTGKGREDSLETLGSFSANNAAAKPALSSAPADEPPVRLGLAGDEDTGAAWEEAGAAVPIPPKSEAAKLGLASPTGAPSWAAGASKGLWPAVLEPGPSPSVAWACDETAPHWNGPLDWGSACDVLVGLLCASDSGCC